MASASSFSVDIVTPFWPFRFFILENWPSTATFFFSVLASSLLGSGVFYFCSGVLDLCSWDLDFFFFSYDFGYSYFSVDFGFSSILADLFFSYFSTDLDLSSFFADFSYGFSVTFSACFFSTFSTVSATFSVDFFFSNFSFLAFQLEKSKPDQKQAKDNSQDTVNYSYIFLHD